MRTINVDLSQDTQYLQSKFCGYADDIKVCVTAVCNCEYNEIRGYEQNRNRCSASVKNPNDRDVLMKPDYTEEELHQAIIST